MPTFETTRSTEIKAPQGRVKALVDDFHEWVKWSPWERIDADLARTYAGAERGVGARYGWSGKKSGQGSMVITASASDRVEIDLDFVKPFKASNKIVFRFEPAGDTTRVSWTMTGERNVAFAILGKLFFDSRIKDFDNGLEQLKAAAEA